MTPSLPQRARIALDILFNRKQRSDLRTANSSPYSWSEQVRDRPQWSSFDFASYTREGYNLNTLVYSAIAYKMRTGILAPLRACEGEVEHPKAAPSDHPLTHLAKRPNKYMSGVQLQMLNDLYLNLSGNAFIFLARPSSSMLPTGMYPLRPDRVFIIPSPHGSKELLGYLYSPSGNAFDPNAKPILPQDMIHLKWPAGEDPLEGMGQGSSPLRSSGRSIDVDNAITSFLKTYFQKGTMVHTYLKFDVPMDPEQVEEARSRFMQIYGGWQNWIGPAVSDQGGEIKTFGMTFKEMGFEALDERNETRAVGPLGVPLILIGARIGLMRSTYSNYREARQAYWEDTRLPELLLFEESYQYHIQSDDGVFLAFDMARVPALRKDIPALVNAWSTLVASGVPKHTAAETVGIDIGTLPDGDRIYMPMNLIPAGEDTSGSDTGMDRAVDATLDTRKSKHSAEGRMRASQWKSIDRTARAWEAKFKEGAKRALELDRREILALISRAREKSLERKQSIQWEETLLEIQDYLAMASRDTWRQVFVPLMQGVITAQGERWAAELGMQFSVRNLFAEKWFDDYVLKFAQPISDTTASAMGLLFQQAQLEGWSIPELQKHLTQVFTQWMEGNLSASEFEWFSDRLPEWRTEMIARTETMRASNAGSMELFSVWGVQRKEWLATKDERVRDTHLAADGQNRRMEEAFEVGGEDLMFPLDSNGSAENTINCRCTLLPVIEE